MVAHMRLCRDVTTVPQDRHIRCLTEQIVAASGQQAGTPPWSGSDASYKANGGEQQVPPAKGCKDWDLRTQLADAKAALDDERQVSP